jgi:hypothetical protein
VLNSIHSLEGFNLGSNVTLAPGTDTQRWSEANMCFHRVALLNSTHSLEGFNLGSNVTLAPGIDTQRWSDANMCFHRAALST